MSGEPPTGAGDESPPDAPSAEDGAPGERAPGESAAAAAGGRADGDERLVSDRDAADALLPRLRKRHRVWRRRLFALTVGALGPLLLVEIGVRLLWDRIAAAGERDLLEAESVSLGPALRLENLNNPGFELRRSDRDHPLFL